MNINQDGNPLNHNEDLIEQQEIQTLGLPFEDSECEEDFLNKAAVIIHKRFETEERSCDYKEHGENSDKSTLEGHQETHTWKNHSKVSMRSQPYLSIRELMWKRKPMNLVKMRIISARCPNLIELTQKRKPLNVVNARNIFTRSPACLTKHQETHIREKLCEGNECRKTFQKSQLTDPQISHTGEKPSGCDDVPVKSALTGQQRTQSEKKFYICNECKKSFHHSSVLKIHQRLHTGEKPYQCNECGISFIAKSNFRHHQKTHTGEKPFKYNECVKTFLQKSQFADHQRTHTGRNPMNVMNVENPSIVSQPYVYIRESI
ncbi:Zinc finger protein 37A [Manis javanica]|nr:Zinc finger protein 37A [Manis javanica]